MDKYWLFRLAFNWKRPCLPFNGLNWLLFFLWMKRPVKLSLQMMQILLRLWGSTSEEEGWGCCLFYRWSWFSTHILLLKEILGDLFLLFPRFSFCNELWLCQFVPVSIFWWLWRLVVFFFGAFVLVLQKIDFWTFVYHFIFFLLCLCLSIKLLLQNFDSLILLWHILFLFFSVLRDFLCAVSLSVLVNELFLMVNYK